MAITITFEHVELVKGRAFANMKPTVEARLCSFAHGPRQHVSLDLLQRYGFRSSFVLRNIEVHAIKQAISNNEVISTLQTICEPRRAGQNAAAAATCGSR